MEMKAVTFYSETIKIINRVSCSNKFCNKNIYFLVSVAVFIKFKFNNKLHIKKFIFKKKKMRNIL